MDSSLILKVFCGRSINSKFKPLCKVANWVSLNTSYEVWKLLIRPLLVVSQDVPSFKFSHCPFDGRREVSISTIYSPSSLHFPLQDNPLCTRRDKPEWIWRVVVLCMKRRGKREKEPQFYGCRTLVRRGASRAEIQTWIPQQTGR